MTYSDKILEFVKRKLISCIRFFPIIAKYSGTPQGYYASSEKYWKLCSDNNLSGVSYTPFLPSSITQRKPPKSIHEKTHYKFDEEYLRINPETFVISIVDGRVFGKAGTIITNDNKLLLDVSLQFGVGNCEEKVKSHYIFNYLKFPEFQYIPETVAVLATAGEGRYFHWLTEVLPRVEILRKSLPNATTEIDKYVVNKGVPIIEESLKILGISSDRLIFADENCHIQAKHLVVPSLAGPTGNPPLWVCEFLRENFLKHKAEIPSIRKLYISRSKAIRRKVANEKDVIECLAEFDFTPVWLEDHDFATQIALFSNAEFIVSPHGAGLTNLIFCNSNVKVLELFPPTYVNVCFWAIANQIGLEYHYLVGKGSKNYNYLDPFTFEDKIDVPIKDLRLSLKVLLQE
jgi:hypothetical protein